MDARTTLSLRAAAVAALLSLSAVGLAAPGDIDPAFGAGGYSRHRIGILLNRITGIAAQADGKYLATVQVEGWSWQNSGASGAVVRYLSNGFVDPTWGTSGQSSARGNPSTITLDSSGRAVVAGHDPFFTYDAANGSSYANVWIARYTTAGSADSTFGTSGRTAALNTTGAIGGTQRFNAVAIAPDGKIVAVGQSNTVFFPELLVGLVARFNADGSLDTTFGPGGQGYLKFSAPGRTGEPVEANGVVVQADGKIVIAGNSGTVATPGSRQALVVRILADGSALDATFGTAGAYQASTGAAGGYDCRAIVADGSRFVIGCGRDLTGANSDLYAFALTSAGALDTGFAPAPVNTGGGLDRIAALARLADGSIVAAGTGHDAGGGRRAFVQNWAGDGTAGATYIDPGITPSDAAAIAISGSDLLVGGRRETLAENDAVVFRLAASTLASSAVMADRPASYTEYMQVNRLPDGSILAGGTKPMGYDGNYLVTRLAPNGGTVGSWGVNGHASMFVPNLTEGVGMRGWDPQPDGTAYFTGDFGGFTANETRIGMGRMISTGPDTTFNAAGPTPGTNYIVPSWNGTMIPTINRDVRVQPSGKSVVLGRNRPVSSNQFALVRFNVDGTQDATFGASGIAVSAFAGGSLPYGFAMAPDGRLFAMGSTAIDLRLAAFTVDGALDASFGTGGMAVIPGPTGYGSLGPGRLLRRPDGSLIVGFSATATDNSAAWYAFARIRPNGTLDTAFGASGFAMVPVSTGPNAFASVWDLALTPNGKIVATGEVPGGVVVRLNPDGTPDGSFGTGGVRKYELSGDWRLTTLSIDVGPDGAMYLAGMLRYGATTEGVVFKTIADVTATQSPSSSDFNADGKPDIIWSNTASGATYLWRMNGPALLSDSFYATIDPSWKIQGVADFNGDGHPDIVWRNTANGACYVWYTVNGVFTGTDAFLFSLPPEWVIQGVADFNQDGKPDFLMRNSVSGNAFAWFFNNASPIGDQFLFNVDPSWKVEAVGDLNADGQPDLLFRSMSSGLSFAWYTNYTGGVLSLGGSSPMIYSIDPVWEVVQLADWNGDGKPDLLFRNAATGLVFVWYLDGVTLGASDFVYQIDPSWEIVPRR